MTTSTFHSSSAYAGSPGWADRSGETVEILAPLTEGEADLGETGPMFHVRFADGIEATVFGDELS